MAKIISYDTFRHRRELKEKEREQALRDQSIARLLVHAKKHCNWEKPNDSIDN